MTHGDWHDNWVPLPNHQGKFSCGIALAADPSSLDQYDAFVIDGTDNRLLHTRGKGTSWRPGWEPLATTTNIYSAPAAAFLDSERTHVVFIGPDDIRRYDLRNDTWVSIGLIGGDPVSHGVAITGRPTSDRFDIFTVDQATRALRHIEWNGSWTHRSLGGSLTSAPAATSTPFPGHIRVVALGNNRGAWLRRMVDGEWDDEAGWINLGGGPFKYNPAVVNNGVHGGIDVFAIGRRDSQLHHLHYTNQSNPGSGWRPLGGRAVTAPAAISQVVFSPAGSRFGDTTVMIIDHDNGPQTLTRRSANPPPEG